MTFRIAFATVHLDLGHAVPPCGETADVELSKRIDHVTCRKCMRTIAYKLRILKLV